MKVPQFTSLPELVDLACTIQQIPSPTFQEGERAQFILQQFVQLGLRETSVDAAGNVYGLLPGQGQARPIVLSAHLDTVHPPTTSLSLKKEPQRITGAGIGDNSLGVAALIGLIWMIKANQSMPYNALPGDIWLVGNICEEGLGNLRGIQAVTDRFGGHPLAYIILEGTCLGEIFHRGLGVDRYRISVLTEGGHSWRDFGRPSAIHILTDIAHKVTSIDVPSSPRSSINIGKIEGGISINSIAPFAMFELDLRSESPESLNYMVRQVKEIVSYREAAGTEVRFEQIGKRPAGSLPPGHPLVHLAQEALQMNGLESHLNIGSTDANMPLSQGYPALCLGVTTGGKVHTIDEYIDVPPISKGMNQLAYFLYHIWENFE